MPPLPEQVEAPIRQAKDYWDQGRVGVVDLICQTLLSQGVSTPQVMLMLGKVAGSLGEFAAALRYLEQSTADFPAEASEAIAEVNRLIEARRSAQLVAGPQKRFHLIKAWGCGFTSDLDHTLGHLLLAEMAGRIPVIHWGRNSLFRDDNVDNAWDHFFQPVSPFKIDDLAHPQYSFYPGQWSARNLRHEASNKLESPELKIPGVTLLNQSAIVTVGDFFTAPLELIPWFMARHPQYRPGQITGEDIEQIYRYLIQKYLKPRPWITTAVEQFATENFRNRKLLALHARGGDKVFETADIADQRTLIFKAVQADLVADPSLFVFLLTDDAGIFDTYNTAFPVESSPPTAFAPAPPRAFTIQTQQADRSWDSKFCETATSPPDATDLWA